ncbi:HAD-superfamily hydrolase,subfamily IIIA [Ostreococcus tauri]|uniref:D,D-heptose 1,7-bisphosphate phosphatase n=2 Tax=Ostreococcus tauri TaxID=70448 RepID=A0A090M5J4_OSTTA|nr:HAD-superfamily hydrolase,subfamily IIIA [Ostreococcus tauri]CEF97932.1 HAD-superfamily hydrolase,subfamily IIIA [Ostreococcus tauri]|eukprot:XP_003079272.2 HAD-superfamily hydrolase,subfamily IIIA [Ostreococcus tauri]
MTSSMRVAPRASTPSRAARTRARATTTTTTTRRPPRLVLLDRDGVINVDVGAPGVTDVKDFRLVRNAARAIRALNDANVRTCVCTNQTAIGKGLVEASYVTETIHGAMRETLARDAGAELGTIYYAWKARTEPCGRRKPEPGMLLEALEECGVEAADAVFVGDTVTDMQAAARAGVGRALVCTGYGETMGEALRARNVSLPHTIVMRADDPTMSFPDECFPFDVYEDLYHFVRCAFADA